ncbi:MAG: hypothetical protein KAR38_13390, partial [Calditrichia bacterium]|nr:hypothetical protein [Calditrichia bacterium]
MKICKVVFLFLLIMIFLLSLFGCESKPKRPVYLNMIYNFTQLSYKGVNFKQLNSPFTRFNATQKIFGLAHRLKGHQQV